MFIDAAVDIAKDPYVFDINANYNTYSIYLTGIRLGIPLPILTRWFNQPIIREYVKLMQQNKSISTQLDKQKLSKNQIIAKAKEAINPTLQGVEAIKKEGDYTIEELENLIKEYVTSQKNKTPRKRVRESL